MTEDEITNMLLSDDFRLPPAQLQAEMIYHDSLPCLDSEFSTFEDIQQTFDLNEAIVDSDSPSSVITRKRKRSEIDTLDGEESVVEPSSVIPEVETQEGAENVMVEPVIETSEKEVETVSAQEKRK